MSSITVDTLISSCRSMLDETNRASVKDIIDILPALNRAQDYAGNILARHYESPLLTSTLIPTVSGQLLYPIPEDAFEERVEKVEVLIGNVYSPVQRVDYRDISSYETKNQTNAIPYYYSVVGNQIKLLPAANGTYPLRIWYLKDPLALVPSQGRINIVNTTGNYVIIDTVGSDLTTEADQLNSYVNIIDGQSGQRKATFQVKNIIGNKLLFKTSPARANVLNIDIDTDMTDLLVNQNTENGLVSVSINPDDYVCLIHGTCVPFFKKPFSNFLIEYAIAELRRKLGGDPNAEERVLQKLEEQVERSWAGREHTLRVTRASKNWTSYGQRRRVYITTG